MGRQWRALGRDDKIQLAFLSITSYQMENGLEKGENGGLETRQEAVVVIQGRDVGAERTGRDGWSPGRLESTGSGDRSHRRGVPAVFQASGLSSWLFTIHTAPLH